MPRTRQSGHLLTQTASEKFNLIDLIPMYDGGESLGIRRFLENINDVANLGKWSNDEKVTILILKLAGIAEEFFFIRPNPQSINRGSSESVQEFAARINKLGTQIFQSGNSAQNTAVRNANDQLLQSRFISGLRNDIRRFVLARDPLNLDESIRAALIEEQNMKLNQIANDERSGLSPSQTENSVFSALKNRLEEINLRVGRLQEANSVTARKTDFVGDVEPPDNQQPGHCRCIKDAKIYRHRGRAADFFGVCDDQFDLAIHQNDHQARRRFVEWAQNEIAVVPDFHKRILFSDEAHFWLNGYVNKPNCRIWSEANPQMYVETPLRREKLTVWCALWAGEILLHKR
ncbi:hypothetical protein TNCV_3953051 [Trichonephila clavipes]|nr:hypothetical protein TNCV_3953051 [Trichonephila clavipes]